MIIDKEEKFLWLLLAFGAKTEKIEAVKGDSIAGFFLHLVAQILESRYLRVQNLSASCADGVWMGIWSIAVVAVAAAREAKFQNLVQLLEQRYSFVNRGQAGGGKE